VAQKKRSLYEKRHGAGAVPDEEPFRTPYEGRQYWKQRPSASARTSRAASPGVVTALPRSLSGVLELFFPTSLLPILHSSAPHPGPTRCPSIAPAFHPPPILAPRRPYLQLTPTCLTGLADLTDSCQRADACTCTGASVLHANTPSMNDKPVSYGLFVRSFVGFWFLVCL